MADHSPAVLVVLAPSGQRHRVVLEALPFSIGRQAGNSLVLRDNRASRNHCHIVF
jgi:pSer/pThr/pTyr-binding forkhead associated (FHA) protein